VDPIPRGLDPDFDPGRPDRGAYWRRKLPRFRLGAEPIGEQVERHRRVTLALTAIASMVGMIFLAIFAAFGRPDVGGIVVGILLVPVVAWAWIDFGVARSRARAYLREREAGSTTDAPPG